VVIVLMGRSIAAATAIGRALAAASAWECVDVGDARSPDNKAAIRSLIERALDRRTHLVLVCPSLQRPDRAAIRGDLRQIRFVDLSALDETSRDDVLRLDAARPLEQIVDAIRREFGV